MATNLVNYLDALVPAAVNGDPEAVGRLLTTIRPMVVRYCRARVGRGERSYTSADDIAQEACLAVLTALPRYEFQGRPFLAFVYGITAHKVADAHRAVARNREQPVADIPDSQEVEASPMQHVLQGESARQINDILGSLPERQRDILVLRIIVGLSAEETAAAVGSTAGAVRVAQHRALTRLRRTVDIAELV
ncbi:sigma-70 family RNA polymerase sigma factor [Kibdelosporangium phytohabitans]|uniref:RNA polymerase subunit sigma n=1 Tax=Kibdelosporangium phytohabitans TaxID=860235 RepID=A0A0N9I9L8_9PSEU|nr:sigma-70 family RNA polymerase sigma factor [Kibdelosporangium phytohabitans]ALG11665.1 RNA polymerase subunit sigma [Kibdelosporangium phytohabitans]MBE1463052.1 RNA polymerase sigma-70 factor (ECF subfamily) [Kibdelosporangium phytohabitans]